MTEFLHLETSGPRRLPSDGYGCNVNYCSQTCRQRATDKSYLLSRGILTLDPLNIDLSDMDFSLQPGIFKLHLPLYTVLGLTKDDVRYCHSDYWTVAAASAVEIFALNMTFFEMLTGWGLGVFEQAPSALL